MSESAIIANTTNILLRDAGIFNIMNRTGLYPIKLNTVGPIEVDPFDPSTWGNGTDVLHSPPQGPL